MTISIAVPLAELFEQRLFEGIGDTPKSQDERVDFCTRALQLWFDQDWWDLYSTWPRCNLVQPSAGNPERNLSLDLLMIILPFCHLVLADRHPSTPRDGRCLWETWHPNRLLRCSRQSSFWIETFSLLRISTYSVEASCLKPGSINLCRTATPTNLPHRNER